MRNLRLHPSQADKKFEDVIKNQRKVNDGDAIHLRKWENHFPKRLFFSKLHHGLSSGIKFISIEKL